MIVNSVLNDATVTSSKLVQVINYIINSVGWLVWWLQARFLRRRSPVRSPLNASCPLTRLRISTASAGDTYSLARKTNPPAASIVPWYGVALGYRKGDKHFRPPQNMGRPAVLFSMYKFINN